MGGTLADAQAPRPDAPPHLLVVPHSPEGQAALDRSDARVVARYEDFTLAEAAGSDDERLREAGAGRRDDMREVNLPAADFDPRADRGSLAARGGPDRDETLAVVQFVGPVKDAWFDRLEATGAQVVQYAAQNGYLVHAHGDEVDRLAGLVGTDTAVRAVTPVLAGDKVADALARSDERTMAVQTVAGAAGETARRQAAAAGPRVRADSTVGELSTQFVRIDGAEAAALAADPAVVSITPWSPPELLDERAARIVAGDLGAGAFDYLSWLAGKGFPSTTFPFAIDVTDQGLDNGVAAGPGHPDFYVNGVKPGNDRVAYAVDYTGEGSAADCGGHGTNVASIAAGYGTTGDSAGFRYGLGIAPRAQIGASKIFTCDGTFDFDGNFTGLTTAAHTAGARISNNSWGMGGLGLYSADSRAYDALVRDARPDQAGNQQMVEVFAAGNDGGSSSGGAPREGYATVQDPATAKNVITVGASESTRSIGGTDGCGISDAEADNPSDILDFSSRGPTDDLRLKPDLVAPGTHVVGASPQHPGYQPVFACNAGSLDGNPLYSLMSGTSQAAPEVTGAAALIRDWYVRKYGSPPSPALTKAILANTATDIAGGDTGKGAAIENAPSTDQGWGRVNVGAALDTTQRLFRDESSPLTTTGASFLDAYQVADPSRPLKVTLAWTDAPGMVGPQADAFVNDLDLMVEAGGRTYRGNVLAGGVSRPGGAADPRNNLESVILPAGTSGHFAVKVVATNLAGDGVPGVGDATDQDFALVVSNASEASTPVLVEHAKSIDDSASAGGDGDGALEPDERFRLGEQLRNAGNASATGVQGSLSGSAVTVTQSSSGWGTLAPGATGTNSPPFAARLSPGVSCGAEVPASLAIATGQGPESVPVTLPTGETASTATVATSSPGVAIPDDNPAGVTSSIEVTNPGRIKDLNVRINSLTHPWVGDLRIDLTGPDGTTVTLAAHPGGPDNGGDNFANTVFNDEIAVNIAAGSPPYTGSFRPQNDQLSRFYGKTQQGTWTLRVRDLVQGMTGTLDSWGLELRRAECDVDQTAPDTTIDTAPANPTNSEGATFAFSSNEAGAGFECMLDGGPFVECSSPKAYAGLADGTHTFSVRAVDGSGNVDATPASYSWVVDTPPDTTITAGPSGLVNVRSAAFGFGSDEPNVVFECRLDGGAFGACGASATFGGLADGQHTLLVRARDPAGQVDDTPAARTWTVDATVPAVTITSPTAGEALTDTTPRLAGTAGRAAGDAGVVTLKLFSGGAAAGAPVQTVTAPRDTFSGAWSREAAPLGDGTYTARAEQTDSAGNLGLSAPVTFSVDTTAPDVAIAPREEYLTDALRRGLTVLAGCASACKLSATLSVPASRARALGLRTPRRSRTVRLAARTAKLGGGQYRALTLPFGRVAKAALRDERLVRATLNLKIAAAGRTLTLRRLGTTLSRSAGLRSAVRRGLRFAGVCSEACNLTGRLMVSRREARRLGLKVAGKAVSIAGGQVRATSSASTLRLRIQRKYRRALLRARRGVSASVEALIRGATGPEQHATGRLDLHR